MKFEVQDGRTIRRYTGFKRCSSKDKPKYILTMIVEDGCESWHLENPKFAVDEVLRMYCDLDRPVSGWWLSVVTD